MIHFNLFGIPVYIRPSFWLVLAFFGGILQVNSLSDFLFVAYFIIAGFLSIMAHEMGHALTGRRLGGGHQLIMLDLGGGVTHSEQVVSTKLNRIKVILAGPAMGFLLGLIGFIALWKITGPILLANGLTAWDLALNPSLAVNVSPKLYVLSCLVWIGEWWTLINLLPIYPLDGGQLLAQLLNSPKKLFLIGTFVSIVIALLNYLWLGGIFLSAFMLFFAYINFKQYKNAPF